MQFNALQYANKVKYYHFWIFMFSTLWRQQCSIRTVWRSAPVSGKGANFCYCSSRKKHKAGSKRQCLCQYVLVFYCFKKMGTSLTTAHQCVKGANIYLKWEFAMAVCYSNCAFHASYVIYRWCDQHPMYLPRCSEQYVTGSSSTPFSFSSFGSNLPPTPPGLSHLLVYSRSRENNKAAYATNAAVLSTAPVTSPWVCAFISHRARVEGD